MSRYRIPATDPRHDIVCGWDNLLWTFFAQVWDTTVPDDEEAEVACVCWLGLEEGAIPTVAALQAALQAYVTLPADLVAQLEEDQRTAGPRSATPPWLVQRLRALV